MPTDKHTNWSELIQARVLLFSKRHDGLLECIIVETVNDDYLKVSFTVDGAEKAGWFAADDVDLITMLKNYSQAEGDALFMAMLRDSIEKGHVVTFQRDEEFAYTTTIEHNRLRYYHTSELLLASLTEAKAEQMAGKVTEH
jgi:hypothetical protein